MKVHLKFFLVFLILIMSFIPAMWNEAANISYSSSYQMKNYPEAAEWLLENMDENELAIVPMIGVFETLEPDLRGKLVHYSDIWKGAGIPLKADNDLIDILTVRRYLLKYLKQKNIEYIVVSPVDPYSARLFKNEITDELALFEVIKFHSEGSLWNDPITIYKPVGARREIFKLTFNSTEPTFDYHTRGDFILNFTSTGMAIRYEGASSVYIPTLVNSSGIENLFLSVHLTEMSSGVEGNIVLYLDKNGNDQWDDWDVDTGILIPLPNKTSFGYGILFSEELYKIGYNIVQVGIVLFGASQQQSITVWSITFYEAYELGE